MAKKWMAKAFAHAHGQFKAAAKKRGKSTLAYARQVTKKGSRASTHRKRQANLVKTAAKTHHRRKRR